MDTNYFATHNILFLLHWKIKQKKNKKGEKLAAEWGVEFIESSAKENENVLEAFETLIRIVRKTRNIEGEKQNRGNGGCCTVL